MKIKLILVAAGNDPLRRHSPFMPLSFSILAGVAPAHQYTFIDMLCGDNPMPIPNEDFDLVGISYRASCEEEAFRLADTYRNAGKLTVVGGPQPTANPEEAARHADIVVAGEAEHTWPILLDDVEKGCYRRFYLSKQVPFQPSGNSFYRAPTDSLSDVPLPNRLPFRKRGYSFDLVYAVRGCPVNCDFCFVSDMFGTLCRTRPVADVLADISAIKRFFYLIDDTVFGRPSTYQYYLQLYNGIRGLRHQRLWTGQANLDAAATSVGREVVKAAASAGLVYAAIGMESVSAETLRFSGTLAKIGAKEGDDTLQQMEQNIRFVQDQGIAISGWFVVGYPADNIQTYYQTLDFCLKNRVFPVITPVSALRGTRLYGTMEAMGRLRDRLTHASNIAHPDIDDHSVLAALREVVHRAYNPKVMIGNTFFYFKKFRNNGVSLNDSLKRAIFVYITQLRLREVLIFEIKRIHEKIS